MIVQMPVLSGQLLQQRNAFFGRLVRQHGAADDVDVLDAHAEPLPSTTGPIRFGPDAMCLKLCRRHCFSVLTPPIAGCGLTVTD